MHRRIILEDTGERRVPCDKELYLYLPMLSIETAEGTPQGGPTEYAILRVLRNDFDTRSPEARKLASINEILNAGAARRDRTIAEEKKRGAWPSLLGPHYKELVEMIALELGRDYSRGPAPLRCEDEIAPAIGATIGTTVGGSGSSFTNNVFRKMRDAIGVIVSAPEIRAWLLANDPKALSQCEDALS